MFLELSKDKIMIVLELSKDDPRPNSMLHNPHFVDTFKSHNFPFGSQVSLVTTTPYPCSLNSASSLSYACLLEVGLKA